MARTVAQLVPDLRRGLSLLRQRAETADLLCRVHRHPVVVLDHRSHHRQFVADTLHDDLMPGIDAARAVKLQGRQTTTARCDARQSVRQGMNHQILNEADRENGVSHFPHALRRIRDSTDVQRGFDQC